MMALNNNEKQELNDDDDGEEKQLQLALRKLGARLFQGPHHRGILVSGWQITAKKLSILTMQAVEQWERNLETSHLPEMVFGDSSLELVHQASGIRIHFNAFDALCSWKKEALPPVEVPAAAKWKMRSKPKQEIVLDYDYTFTTSYSGSEAFENLTDGVSQSFKLEWTHTQDRIDLLALQARDPILFYDEVVLYEDELADNGISLLTVKVRVMPSCWFLLLRFWLRVDGVLMRLRDTRMYCSFQHTAGDGVCPVVLRDRCIREGSIKDLLTRGVLPDMLGDKDGSLVHDKLQVCKQFTEKLVVKKC